MRSTILLLLLSIAAPLRSAALPRLAGMVLLPDFKRVVFESSLDAPSGRSELWPGIYAEGERDGKVEFLSIDVKSWTLKVHSYGEDLTLTLQPPVEKDAPNPTIYLE